MTFVIWGKTSGARKEEIDQADTERDARYLVHEYRMAFGSDWNIWYTKESQ